MLSVLMCSTRSVYYAVYIMHSAHLQKREEDERSIQELLEQNAQLELEKQRM